MNKSIDKIKELYIEYENHPYACEKMTEYICNKLPIDIICWKKEYEKKNIEKETNKFIDDFLKNELVHYYYIKKTDIFIKYDFNNYKVINEDDILYLILNKVSCHKNIMSKKQIIKNYIMKEIKKRSLTVGIPESTTIQHIINYLYPVIFKTKSEAKYFLCILGDHFLKKSTNTHYVIRKKTMKLIEHIQYCFKDYFNDDIIYNFITDIYAIKNNYENFNENTIMLKCRILDFQKSVENSSYWQYFIDQNILNIVSVAIHYSQRYDNAESYLHNKIENKEKILYLKEHSKKDIIKKFIIKYIKDDNNNYIVDNELYYLWNLFLIEENIPCFFKEKKIFSVLFEQVKNNKRIDNKYLNVSSEKLFIVRKFNDFWKSCIKEEQHEVLEISEIFYFFKQKTNIKTSSEKEMILMINYFYPYIKILNDKYINNISCNLWNKKETIKNVIIEIKEKEDIHKLTNIKLYKKYCKYLKDKNNELVVNKTYFMEVINKIKNNNI